MAHLLISWHRDLEIIKLITRCAHGKRCKFAVFFCRSLLLFLSDSCILKGE